MATALWTAVRRRLGWDRPRPVRTPTVLQMEAVECGAAALGIVLAHHGRWLPIEELRVACGISRDGSKASNILRAARRYGLEAQGFKLEPAGLRRLPPPVILHWNFNHFVVLEGFLGRGRVRINDPRTGPQTITEEELDESLTGVVLAFEKGPDFERSGAPPRLLSALRRRVSGARVALIFVVLASLALVVPGLITPAFSRIFVDEVLLGGQRSWLMPLLASMAAVAFVVGILTWLQQRYLLRLETKMAIAESSRYIWHLLRLPIEFFNQRFPGDISHRVGINDRIAQLLSRDLAANALGAALIVFFALVMVQYDAVLTAVGIAVVSLNVAALRWVSRKRVDGSRRLLQEQGKLTGTGLGGLQMIETLKATGSESDLFAQWAGYQAKVINIRQGLDRFTEWLAAVPPLLTAINFAIILGVGGARVVDNELSLGALVAFQVLMASFIAPVNRLVSLGGKLQTVDGEMSRLDDVMRYEPVLPADLGIANQDVEASAPVKLAGHLEMRRVTFGYNRLEAPLIEGFDLELRPGSRTAIVGKTGSGKSTLAKLVVGLYEPWSGEILFDGRPRAAVPRHVMTNSVAVVDQDVFVFEGSIRDNLTLWDSTIPQARVVAAAKDACIHDDVIARAGGYDSAMAEGGSNWSGGQLQRLEIARALATEPSLLVLDEATSALDPETELEIDENLRRRGCACLIVAHRLSTIRDADEIIVLDDGAVIARGTHERLIEAGGAYADLIASE